MEEKTKIRKIKSIMQFIYFAGFFLPTNFSTVFLFWRFYSRRSVYWIYAHDIYFKPRT